MTDRTASALAHRKSIVTCPSWCELGEHTHLDPHHASIGTIVAPGFEAEMSIRQYPPMGRVTPPPQVVLTLDTTGRGGRVTGCHTMAIPLPPDTDVETFLAESDHEPPPATVLVGPGITFEPYRHRPAAPAEDLRVTRARTVLARARTALGDDTRPCDMTAMAGHLLAAVEGLLGVIGEREGARL